MHALAVDRDLDLVRVLEAAHDVQVGAIELDLEDVLAVERKRVAHEQCRRRCRAAGLRCAGSATGPGERGTCRCPAPMSGSPTASALIFLRRRQIALLQRRRDAEHVGDIVEAVGRIVGRQQRRDVDVEREQIANRVGVFGAVEAMEHRPARDSASPPPPDPARLRAKRISSWYGRPWSGRRAPAAASCRSAASARPFPTSSGASAIVREIQAVERQIRRLEPLVVAGDAVAIDRLALRPGSGCPRRDSRSAETTAVCGLDASRAVQAAQTVHSDTTTTKMVRFTLILSLSLSPGSRTLSMNCRILLRPGCWSLRSRSRLASGRAPPTQPCRPSDLRQPSTKTSRPSCSSSAPRAIARSTRPTAVLPRGTRSVLPAPRSRCWSIATSAPTPGRSRRPPGRGSCRRGFRSGATCAFANERRLRDDQIATDPAMGRGRVA